VHLTLVEERAVLDPGEVPSLVDSDGRFHARVAEFTRRYYRGQIRRSEVRRELDAQIRKIREAGIAISHADSHQHVHMLPGVFRETVALARDHSIPRIRIPAEPVHPYMFRDVRNVSRVLELLALRFFCALARRSPVSTADSFAGFYYGGRMNKRHLREILEHLPATGTCELMCHPGLDAPQSVYSYWRYRWNDELEALVAPEIAALLRQRGVTLASFPAAGKNTIEQWN